MTDEEYHQEMYNAMQRKAEDGLEFWRGVGWGLAILLFVVVFLGAVAIALGWW